MCAIMVRRSFAWGAAALAVLGFAWPARSADVSSHPLYKAAVAMKAKDMKEARKLIDQCEDPDKKQPVFYVVNAYYYLQCDNYAYTLTASRTAARMDDKLIEPYLYMSLAQALARRGKDAMNAIELGQKVEASDARFLYASGLAQAALSQWDKARQAFNQAGQTKPPLADEAKRRVEDLDKYASAIRAIKDEKDKLNSKLQDVKSRVSRVTAEGKKSDDELRSLRSKYYDEREQANRDYNRHINSLGRPGNDAGSQQNYTRQLEGARNELNQRMRQLDDRYRPNVAKAQNEAVGDGTYAD